MKGKIIIIASIIIIGAVFFVPNSLDTISNSLGVSDSMKLNINDFQNGFIQKVEGTIGGSTDLIAHKFDDFKDQSSNIIPDIP